MRSNVLVSNDGAYFKYNITKGTSEKYYIIISATNLSWKEELSELDYSPVIFTQDSKQFIFKRKDTLFFLNLQSKKINKITHVKTAKNPDNNSIQWIAYLLNDISQTLVVRNLTNEKEYQFTNIVNFFFAKTGNSILLLSKTNDETVPRNILKLVSLPAATCTEIWSYPISNETSNNFFIGYDFSQDGSQLSFTVRHDDNKFPYYDLWYFKKGMNKAVLKASNSSAGIKPSLQIFSSTPHFSKDENYIFFDLYLPDNPPLKNNSVNVDIWSYRDTVLQCSQLGQTFPPIYNAVISIKDNQVIQLTNDYERIKTYAEIQPAVVVGYNTTGDRFWTTQEDTNWLVSLKDGSRKLLPPGNKDFIFSPGGKYLLYYDRNDYNFYNYNPVTNNSVKITWGVEPGIFAFQGDFDFDEPTNLPRTARGIAGWELNDAALFVYDKYDIWRLDPAGKCRAVNLTNSYGSSHKIKFRFANGMANLNLPVVFKRNDSVLLTAFDTDKKYNGFFTTPLYKQENPTQLVMGPYVYDLIAPQLLPLNPVNFSAGFGMIPIKFNNSNTWIIMRQSSCDAPNYFLTSDFKTYKQLTNYQPQKDYNWLSAELVNWQQPDGRFSQGILYKPENFDSTKKYPVIFNYYQQRTHRLYQFPYPQLMIADINVSWFVSRGYLVFTPDIYFRYGEPFESAYNTIVSAANRLLQFPFVDKTKMGINGHSMAGGITNYLITHTNLFAAAYSSAGASNLISASLQLGKIEYEISRMERMELFMGDISIWKNPAKYLENSPIMNANQVVTPLLIMHNKPDGGMPWAQSLELFLALRRLEKPVWMLQYDNGDHTLWGRKEEAVDLTIRITEFFDHYLKGTPAPRWMMQGIPAKLKGIEMGY